MSFAATRTPADVARAAFDAVSRRDPDGIAAVGAPGYVDDFVAVGEVRGVDVMEIADGLIQHNTIYYDGVTFARQIGLLPGLGSRADRALLAAFNAKTTLSQRIRDRRRGRSSGTR